MPRPKTRIAVLLVDDEEMFREFLTECLEGEGYDVVTAASGEEALRRHAEPGSPAFDLVVTDLLMPGLTGVALVARLRQNQPNLKVLFMSGYADANAPEMSGHVGPEPLLGKPFTPPEFLAAVRKAVGPAPPKSPEATTPARKPRLPR